MYSFHSWLSTDMKQAESQEDDVSIEGMKILLA
mgnify:CR=1 FL=1